jgi:putative membrane protein
MKDEQQIREEAERDADPRIDLAIERTLLAWERTQLAWIRTVFGLVVAGIALDRGFVALHEARLVTGDAWVKNGHLAGLVMAISGTVLMVIATTYYTRRMIELTRLMKKRRGILDPGLILSLIVTIVGILVIYFMLID